MYDWKADACPNLPSAYAVCNVMDGSPEGWKQVTQGTLSRAGLIGLGIFLAGERSPAKLIAYSLAAAATIEAAVIHFIWQQRSNVALGFGAAGGPGDRGKVESREERSPAMYGAYEFDPDPTHTRFTLLPSHQRRFDATHVHTALLNEGLGAPLPGVNMSALQLGSALAVGFGIAWLTRGLTEGDWSAPLDVAAAQELLPCALVYTTGVVVGYNGPEWFGGEADVAIL